MFLGAWSSGRFVEPGARGLLGRSSKNGACSVTAWHQKDKAHPGRVGRGQRPRVKSQIVSV
jgi:hypothetical protein